MKKVWLFFRWWCSFLVGVFCLGAIFLYLGILTLTPLKYDFEWYQLYFYLMVCLLPFFRLKHENWFSGTDAYTSPREQALQQYHQDVARQYKGGRWSTKGVRVNPYEYTSPYTQSYDNSFGFGYSLAKRLLMSLLFIILGPLFYVVARMRKNKA